MGLSALSPAWRAACRHLLLAWLALIAVFHRDWAAMFAQWWDSSTYNHILLVPVIVAWLVWQRLPEVLQLEPRVWRGGLVAFALCVFGWVLGSFADFNLLRQAAAVAMLPATVLLLLGPRLCAALLFPLCYMAFLVPFGDELVPPLQTITAALTIALVNLSGVPASIDGVFIDTPAGLFEVAEACSGVKFLIAMVALGVLVANVGFKGWGKRAAFLVLCVVVPILANGVRAWGTIFAAQYVGVERAAGIDHLIYGWIFFAVVIAAVLGLSWRFFDRSLDEPMIDAAGIAADSRFDRFERAIPAPRLALAAAALTVAVGLGWSALAMNLSAPLPRQVFLPEVPGWQRTDYAPRAPWEPLAGGADHRLLGSYTDGRGRRVDVFFALYAKQGEGKEAGGFGQGALRPDTGWAWTSNGPAVAAGRSERLIHNGTVERLAYTWYRSGDLLTGSNMQLKLANIRDRLMLRARPTATLILSAEQAPSGDAKAALADFQAAVGPLGPWMDRIGEAR
ncbi:MAG TPA: exosortase A [Novosphingobium sp.]|nr:exosortase A [Novosphingobium sp.]